MSLRKNNFIIGVSVLLAFIGVGVFGLLPLGHAEHGMETPMTNCPYTEGGFAICENTLDHIAGWQQFSNIIYPTLFVLLVLAGILYFIGKQNLSNQGRRFFRRKSYLHNKKLHSYQEDIIKWLALFENRSEEHTSELQSHVNLVC